MNKWHDMTEKEAIDKLEKIKEITDLPIDPLNAWIYFQKIKRILEEENE